MRGRKVRTYAARTLTLTIARAPEEVLMFLREPANLRLWMAYDGKVEMQPLGEDEWLVELPQGAHVIGFPAANDFGVMDHAFYQQGHERHVVPMRVFANGQGCEITYTLVQPPTVSDEESASAVSWTESDLQALKSCLEA